jgi:adenylyltransferase/sulfurtransferase
MVVRINDRARDRYHALSISSVWSLPRIRKTRALVVGAGALGNEVTKNLAMMGVASIIVLDRDTVETANLTRSVFYREIDHGRPKSQVLAERLHELNPDVAVLPVQGDLESALGLGLLRRVDLVFSCLDSRLARRNLNRMCEKVGSSWVDGAMEDLLGEVVVYVPGKTACYECNLTQVDLEVMHEAKSCRGIALQSLALGKVPTTSTMGSIVSAIQVQEAFKILHDDVSRSLAGFRLMINCAVNDFLQVKLDRKKGCDGHFRFGEIVEVEGWTTSGTTAREILSRFQQETGEAGWLEIGREVVTALNCPNCEVVSPVSPFRPNVTESEAKCPKCGNLRVPETTHYVAPDDRQGDWPLSQLGIPPLDIIQVRGAELSRYYELSGDLERFSDVLGTSKVEPAPLRAI